ncbi:hypothetical protein C0J52_04550 [Blattella germanica]|nr:hypothetical protein C0J52_04550 [Blattella germanica]
MAGANFESDIELEYLTPPEIETEALNVINNLLPQIELISSVLMCVTLRLNLLNNHRQCAMMRHTYAVRCS